MTGGSKQLHFIKTSFTTDEQEMILSTEIQTTHEKDTESVMHETIDKVFLLSQNEAVTYLPYEDIRIGYGGVMRRFSSRHKTTSWWTRSTTEGGEWKGKATEKDSDVVCVNILGTMFSDKQSYSQGVRPALWLKKGDI